MRAFLALTAAGLIAGCSSAPAGPVTETGDLATGDRTLVSGELADSFTFRMKEGQWVRVNLNSTAFDPYIILRPPSGAASENDDATPGDRQHSQVVLRAPAAGQYEIVVTSFEPGESGAYTLVYEVSDTQPQSVAPAGGAPGTTTAAPDAVAPDAVAPETAAPEAPDAAAEEASDGVKI